MKTNRNTIVALFVIVVLSFVLSACNPGETVSKVASAAFTGNEPASHQTVQWSERNLCGSNGDGSVTGLSNGINQMGTILGAIDADLKAAGTSELKITTDQWLDAHMDTIKCIAPNSDK